jgi:amidase
MSNLVWKPVVELAQMIRGSSASRSVRHISAIELLDAHLEQIAQHNPKLNAICTLNEENARIRAKQADEALARGENWDALHGVPVTIKDIFETAGLRTTAGYIPLKDYVPQQDATAVTRLKAAGAIVLGVYEDTQRLEAMFARLAAQGISEATALPIVD